MEQGAESCGGEELPGIKVQRCTVHKLRNLERYTPRHALEEVKSDYHRIINAQSGEEGRKAYREFVVKWKKLIPKVVVSLEEAGEELLHSTVFPTANGNRFAPPMPLSGSTGSFAAESRLRARCRVPRPPSSCCLG